MEGPITRRDLLVGSAGTMLAAGLPVAPALGAEHSGHAGAHGALIAASDACVAEGKTCVAHCLDMFAAGDTSLAACAQSVSEMVPACQAVAALARLDSKRLAAFLGPCVEVCTDCEAECRKHADKHPVCKSCAEACAKFIAEAKKQTVAT